MKAKFLFFYLMMAFSLPSFASPYGYLYNGFCYDSLVNATNDLNSTLSYVISTPPSTVNFASCTYIGQSTVSYVANQNGFIDLNSAVQFDSDTFQHIVGGCLLIFITGWGAGALQRLLNGRYENVN